MPPSCCNHSTVYVDEFFKPLICDADMVVQNIQQVTTSAVQVFHRHGFMRNLNVGKTEDIVSFCEPKAHPSQHHLYSVLHCVVHVDVDVFGRSSSYDVRCADLYKNLGTRTHSSKSIMPLLRQRTAATRPNAESFQAALSHCGVR